MKVTILDIKDDKVIFERKNGYYVSSWEGKFPEVNKDYDVSLQIKEVLTFGKEVTLSNDISLEIQEHPHEDYIIGILESADDDGFCVVRIEDSLLFCTIIGAKNYVGNFIKINIRKIHAVNTTF